MQQAENSIMPFPIVKSIVCTGPEQQSGDIARKALPTDKRETGRNTAKQQSTGETAGGVFPVTDNNSLLFMQI